MGVKTVRSLKTKKYEIERPECKATLIVVVSREVITEAVRGEYEDVVEVKKSNQSKLT